MHVSEQCIRWFRSVASSRNTSRLAATRYCAAAVLGWFAATSVQAACAPNLDFQFRRLGSDEQVKLCEAYGDRVVLVVNTASKCAFTPQYEGLEALHARFADRGLVVLGFPSNDFGNQEPGAEAQIQDFCRLTYGVQFPMFEKTTVRKGAAHPFYQRLAQQAGEYPRWNFHKYLLDHSGRLVASYVSQTAPDDPRLLKQLEALLQQRQQQGR